MAKPHTGDSDVFGLSIEELIGGVYVPQTTCFELRLTGEDKGRVVFGRLVWTILSC